MLRTKEITASLGGIHVRKKDNECKAADVLWNSRNDCPFAGFHRRDKDKSEEDGLIILSEILLFQGRTGV